MKKALLLFSIAALVLGCKVDGIYYRGKVKDWQAKLPKEAPKTAFSLYLIGDAGKGGEDSSHTFTSLRTQLMQDQAKAGVIFLGDNLYREGLHKKEHPDRQSDEAKLNEQLDLLKDFDGKAFLIPGNHDWHRQGPKGDKFIKREERYVEKYAQRGNIFLPDGGCPGPVDEEIAPGVVVIFIDTQWLLHAFDRPEGDKDDCDAINEDDFYLQFKDLLKKHRRKHVIVAGHHPMYSNGYHGGHFPIKEHLFPLTAFSKKAYVPLPVIGSSYPLYRKYFGSRQDIPHPVHQRMKSRLTGLMAAYSNVIYVSGHEHNLQYKPKDQNHFIVSGAGSKVTYLKGNRQIEFGAQKRGYTKLSFTDEGEVWMEYIIEGTDGSDQIAYRKMLYQKDIPEAEVKDIKRISYAGQLKTVVSEASYQASGFKQIWFGKLNRKTWVAPLEVLVLDIHYEKGGLTPIKMGGGAQTHSMRLQGGDGHQYVIRSIDKDATFLVSKDLQNTLAQDVIYDAIAASYPYAAVAVPPIADAVGVYHTNPKLVYVPEDSVLGDYFEVFAGRFCLFEERPDGDMTHAPSFGRSPKVMSYSKAIDNMHSKHKHVIDYEYTLKARLLDNLLGDWDRHDDQWRWAQFEEDGKKVYRPIPRDRDQVFFKFDGIFPKLTASEMFVPKFHSFEHRIQNLKGLNSQGKWFDRSFLVGLDKSQWLTIAEEMQAALTDEVLEKAVALLPKPALDMDGKLLIEKLKQRRDDLKEYAEEYYRILAKEVDVVGTVNEDFFEVKRLNDQQVEVNVFARKDGKKDKKKQIFHRVFERSETQEIRLYGLDGMDEYEITGEVRKSILIRIIGGEKDDRVKDQSSVGGLGKKTILYDDDKQKRGKIDASKELKVKLQPKKHAYTWERKEFQYNKFLIIPSAGFNPDDEIKVGLSYTKTNYGFKKAPYKTRYSIGGYAAPGIEGFGLDYKLHKVEALGKWDFAVDAQVRNPYFFYFFGEGNDTESAFDFRAFRIRLNQYRFSPSILRRSKSGMHRFELGADYRYVGFEDAEGISVLDSFPSSENYLGYHAAYTISSVDSENKATIGAKLKIKGGWERSLSNAQVDYYYLRTSLAFYRPLYWMPVQTIMAFRVGSAHNFGDKYAFFQNNFLDGNLNFRGVRRNRFAGRSIYYANFDVRSKVTRVKNYYLPFGIGLLAHADAGKVYNKEQNLFTQGWHHSLGGGIFIEILDALDLVTTYSVSDDDRIFQLKTRFMF